MTLFLSDSCGPDELTCKNGQCVDKDYLCDGNPQYYGKCDDDSDEDEGVCGKSYMVIIIHLFISCLMLDLHTNRKSSYSSLKDASFACQALSQWNHSLIWILV